MDPKQCLRYCKMWEKKQGTENDDEEDHKKMVDKGLIMGWTKFTTFMLTVTFLLFLVYVSELNWTSCNNCTIIYGSNMEVPKRKN